MTFSQPPINVRDLRPLSNHSVAPGGPMRAYIGPQYDYKKIWNLQQEPNEEDYDYFGFIRAFDVLPLIGATFKIQRDSQLSLGLLKVLKTKLPEVPWTDVEVSPFPFRRYFIIDTSIAAPADEATRSPMAISLFGKVTSLEADAQQYAYNYWTAMKEGNFQQAFELQRSLGETEAGWPKWLANELIAEMEIRISEAVYANLSYVLRKFYN